MGKVNWEELAQLDGLRPVVDPKDTTGFKNRLIDALHWAALRTEFGASKRILDFGCGTGRFASRIMAMGIDYTGADSSSGMVEKAQGINPNARFHHFDGRRLPFESNAFDTCFSCGTFQFFIGEEYCHNIISEIARVLRPQGTLLFLEQASLSHSKSLSVERSSTEQDYVNVLAEHVDVKRIRRIRSCHTPQLSYVSFRVAKRIPFLFQWFLNRLAEKEIKKYEKKDEQYYNSVEYYDFVLRAVVK